MRDLNITDLAEITGLSRKTVSKRLEQSGIQQSKTYNSEKALAAIYAFETAGLRLDMLNKSQLATVTGFSHNTVSDRLGAGLVIPNDEGMYDAPQAIAAIFEAAETAVIPPDEEPEYEPDERHTNRQNYETYRTAYMRAKAEREQLTLDKERGRYLLVDEVKEHLGAILRNLRTRLLAVPQRISQTLSPGDEPRTIEKKIMQEVETALNELSRLKL
jgi:phage terminase Nu1 subunit (DNA packaging protein)